MCATYKHTQHIYPPLTRGERRTFRDVKDPPANWGASFCAINLLYLRLDRILCSRVSLKSLPGQLTQKVPSLDNLIDKTFLVRFCKVPRMEACFQKVPPLKKIVVLVVYAVGGTREGAFWKFRSQSSTWLSHISKLWRLSKRNKMKDQVTCHVTSPGFWLLTSL